MASRITYYYNVCVDCQVIIKATSVKALHLKHRVHYKGKHRSVAVPAISLQCSEGARDIVDAVFLDAKVVKAPDGYFYIMDTNIGKAVRNQTTTRSSDKAETKFIAKHA